MNAGTETAGIGEFPVSFSGRDCLHLHGGLLYEGDSYPDSSDFAGWKKRLEAQANPYLAEFDDPGRRIMFHVTVREKGSPLFQVRGEVVVLLGAA